jgi:hypothetical protein
VTRPGQARHQAVAPTAPTAPAPAPGAGTSVLLTISPFPPPWTSG